MKDHSKRDGKIVYMLLILAVPVFWTLLMSGCALQWESAIKTAKPDTPSSNSKQLLAHARSLYERADDLASLNASIEAYQAALTSNPGDYEALVQLSNQYILLGTAHTVSRKEKTEIFTTAMHYAERAMYTNPRFKTSVQNGRLPWEAASQLDKKQTEAMFFWVTALQYEFKEGMGIASKIRNIEWMNRGLAFLKRIEEINPGYGDGAVEFAMAISYYVLPKSKGGSKKTGEAYMQQAVDKGGKRLLPRWGRGKYYYPIKGNTAKSREDLEWVANRPLKDAVDPYPWRVYFKNDAKKLIQ